MADHPNLPGMQRQEGAAAGGGLGRVQTACDRCTFGVMDAGNPHLHGLCECACHATEQSDWPDDDHAEGLRRRCSNPHCGGTW